MGFFIIILGGGTTGVSPLVPRLPYVLGPKILDWLEEKKVTVVTKREMMEREAGFTKTKLIIRCW